MKNKILSIILSLTLVGCSHSVPKEYKSLDEKAEIYPDYYDVTIPSNIAPMNFKIENQGDEYITRIYATDGDEIIVPGNDVRIDIDKWREMLSASVGDTVRADIYVNDGGEWHLYAPIKWAVAEEIDPYVTYRLIEPSYVNFETMRICQRDLRGFEEKEIFNNCTFSNDTEGQCLNCHTPQDYNRTGRWQMHVRLNKGGTIIAEGDNVKKVNLNRPGTISAGVYPAWHPTLPLIVYSNNNTVQTFHSNDPNKIEVQDSASDLVLYDMENDQLTIVANDSTEWETFPTWSPDGRYIYYVSATVPALNKIDLSWYKKDHFDEIRYNIYRRAFDPDNHTFGAVDTVYMASERETSATLPRVSPDGKYLLFTQGKYGTFHIWHHDADLYLMDLADSEVRPLDEANSDDTESYHTWSSNGRWIIFSSRRDDGSYTRLYITYFDSDGNAHKPFLLPQDDPMHNIRLFKSYNIPEFACQPVSATKADIIRALEQE